MVLKKSRYANKKKKIKIIEININQNQGKLIKSYKNQGKLIKSNKKNLYCMIIESRKIRKSHQFIKKIKVIEDKKKLPVVCCVCRVIALSGYS